MRKVSFFTATITAFLILIMADVAPAREAAGSVFGALNTGRAVPKRAGMAGLGVGMGMGSGHRNSFVGSLNYGLFEYTEATLKIGLADADKVRLAVGADFKYQLLDAGTELNDFMDFSVGAFSEYVKDAWQVGFQALGSRPFQLSGMQVLAPYGRFNVRIEHFNKTSHIEFGANAGVRWGITRNISAFLELQVDSNEAIFLGLRDSIF